MSDEHVINAFEIPGEPPEWIMLARLGVWAGHPQRPYRIGTDEIQAMHDHFQGDVAANGKELVIDYQHESLRRTKGAGAAGWIDRTEIRGDGAELWGHVSQWVGDAPQAIRERRYRYHSPVYLFNRKDRVTGRIRPAMLHSVALLNVPFLTELPALLNAFDPGADTSSEEEDGRMKEGIVVALLAFIASVLGGSTKGIANALGVAEDAPAKDLWVAFAKQLLDPDAQIPDAVANALGVSADTKAEHFLDAVLAAGQPLAPKEVLPQAIANELGVEPDCDLSIAQGALLALKASSALTPIANSLGLEQEADMPAILGKIQEMLGAQADREAEDIVANGMAAGKITPAMRDYWLAQARSDPASTQAAIQKLPVIVANARHAPKGAPPVTPQALSDEQKRICRQMGVTEEAFRAAGA